MIIRQVWSCFILFDHVCPSSIRFYMTNPGATLTFYLVRPPIETLFNLPLIIPLDMEKVFHLTSVPFKTLSEKWFLELALDAQTTIEPESSIISFVNWYLYVLELDFVMLLRLPEFFYSFQAVIWVLDFIWNCIHTLLTSVPHVRFT